VRKKEPLPRKGVLNPPEGDLYKLRTLKRGTQEAKQGDNRGKKGVAFFEKAK